MTELARRRAALLARRAARPERTDARQKRIPRKPSPRPLERLYRQSLIEWRRMMTARLDEAFAVWKRARRPGLKRRDSDDEDGGPLDESEAADLIYWLRRSLSDEPIKLPSAPSEAAIRALGDQAARLSEAEARRTLVAAGADEAKIAGKLDIAPTMVRRIDIAPTKAMQAGLEAWSRVNLDLIVRIPQSWLVGTEKWMSQTIRAGARVNVLQDDLIKRLGIGERHARLIARDQIGKLNGQVTETVQRLAGVSSYVWTTVDDERVRGRPGGRYPRAHPSHYALDGTVHKWGSPPVAGPGTQRRDPGAAIQCFASGTLVASGVEAVARSEYRGAMLTFQTVGDRRLSVTPNHPILTARGWLAAKEVKQSDHVLCAPVDLFSVGHENPDHRPAAIDEVFSLLAVTGRVGLRGAIGEDLHGDAVNIHGKIEIVGVDSALRGGGDAVTLEGLRKLALMAPDARDVALVPDGATGNDLLCRGLARPLPSGGALALDAAGRRLDRRPLQRLSLGPAADVDAFLAQHLHDRRPGNPEVVRDLQHRDALSVHGERGRNVDGVRDPLAGPLVGGDGLEARATERRENGLWVAPAGCGEGLDWRPGGVLTDEIVHIEVDLDFVGHVYDLQTTTGIVVAGGIICSNCRCYAEPVVPDDIMADDGPSSTVANHRKSKPWAGPLDPSWRAPSR